MPLAAFRTLAHAHGSVQPISVLPIFSLVQHTELQVRSRDFEDDVLAAFEQSHPPVCVAVRPANCLELDIDFEVRAVPADERALQSRGQTTFRGEHREESLSGHAGLDCLHSLQSFCDPDHVILSLKGHRATDKGGCK